MKQTAVEWLENEFQEIFKECGGIDTNWIKRFEQAKAMEEEQMKEMYLKGIENYDPTFKRKDNETFKSE